MLSNCGAGEDSWESLDSKEIKPVNPKENQPRIFIGRTDAEAEASILWPPDAKSHFTGKDPDAGKDWRQKEKGEIEDERLDSIINSVVINLSKLWKIVEDRGTWHAAVHGVPRVGHLTPCSVSLVWLFVTPWTAAHKASLSHFPEFSQIYVHWVSDAIQPSHPLSSPFPPAFNISQHQSLF